MKDFNTPLNNQVVVMSRADLTALVEELTSRMATSKNEREDEPLEYENERYVTRREACNLLHVDFTTLWRWNKAGLLCCKKVGPRRVMYKYSDIMRLINGQK